MSKNKKGYGRGTFLETRIFLSPAWLSLNEKSKKSAQVLVLFLGKRKFGKVKVKGKKEMMRTDDNRLTLTYAEIEARGITRGSFARAIDELLAKGFIKISHQGGAYEKDKTIYSLVDDYLQWRPNVPPIRTRARDLKRGFQGAGLGAVKKLSHAQTEPPTDTQTEPPLRLHRRTGGPTSQKQKKAQKPQMEFV